MIPSPTYTCAMCRQAVAVEDTIAHNPKTGSAICDTCFSNAIKHGAVLTPAKLPPESKAAQSPGGF